MHIQISGAHNCESQNSKCVSLLIDDVPVPAVDYQIISPDGKIVFYTGDTGPDLAGFRAN